MAKTGFEKATSKMFGDFGSPVRVAQPQAGGRPSREERERMREEAEEAVRHEAEEQRAQERRQVLQDLVDMNVLPAGSKEGGSGVQGGVEVKMEAMLAEGRGEEKRGRGRPPKGERGKDCVLMNFRVGVDFRQKLKVMAAEQGKSVLDLFDEAFVLLFEKYGLN